MGPLAHSLGPAAPAQGFLETHRAQARLDFVLQGRFFLPVLTKG